MHRTTARPRPFASIRGQLVWALAVAMALSGCDQRTSAPAPASSPVPPATSASAGVDADARVPLHFSTDDPAIGTEVGARVLGTGTTTTGKAGWLLFGPYAALPAGSYQAAVRGVALPGHAGTVYVDVAAGKGTRIIAAVDLDPAALAAARSPDGMIVLPFTLAGTVEDLELRMRVTEQSQLAVSAIDILPVR